MNEKIAAAIEKIQSLKSLVEELDQELNRETLKDYVRIVDETKSQLFPELKERLCEIELLLNEIQ